MRPTQRRVEACALGPGRVKWRNPKVVQFPVFCGPFLTANQHLVDENKDERVAGRGSRAAPSHQPFQRSSASTCTTRTALAAPLTLNSALPYSTALHSVQESNGKGSNRGMKFIGQRGLIGRSRDESTRLRLQKCYAAFRHAAYCRSLSARLLIPPLRHLSLSLFYQHYAPITRDAINRLGHPFPVTPSQAQRTRDSSIFTPSPSQVPPLRQSV